MSPVHVISSQYLAALRMLRQAIARCPEALWDDARDANRFWHVAFHTLFYTHLYLQPTVADFQSWAGHREGLNRFDARSEATRPYTQADLLAYCDVCERQVRDLVPQLDWEGPSGFEWLPFGKLELQVYSIRHIQQHTGELMERLGSRAGIHVDWVGLGMIVADASS
jgi:hypothetical protein